MTGLRGSDVLRTLSALPDHQPPRWVAAQQETARRASTLTAMDLPPINAALNCLSALLLLLGYLQIKRQRITSHRRLMLSALLSSAAFLACYLVYHSAVGSVPYPHQDWTRPLYFAVLIPHILLATLNVPLIVALVWFAASGRFIWHKRLARWTWPSWMFVSVSGITVYLMLYQMGP
jgi:putative membrane protein